MKNCKMLLYTLAGVAVGVGVGILLAPAAGNETRSRLACSLEKLRSKLSLTEEEFSESELEMDATTGGRYGF